MPPSPDDERWMALALAQARDAGRAGEVPVGAVVVRDGRLVAAGRNSPIASRDPSAHAEINALRAAAQALGNYRLDGCQLFVTLEPCPMCAGAMLHARLARVVFGAADPRTGAAGSVTDLFAQPLLNHHTEATGGVCAAECGALLQDFFRDRRQAARAGAEPLRDDALRTPDGRFEPFAPALPPPRYVSGLPALDGWRLAWVESAPGGPVHEREPLLCLHGPGQWGYLFRELPPLLPARRMLVPDLIGCGRSDKPKRPDRLAAAWQAAGLAQWLASLGVTQIELLHHPGSQAVADALARQPGLRVLRACTFTPEAASVQTQAAWRAPFPDRGHEAILRALGRR
ncbi:MAG: tRNA adenosine(34) deaminase TadA, partial [Xenophilus sp.]